MAKNKENEEMKKEVDIETIQKRIRKMILEREKKDPQNVEYWSNSE